MSRLCFHFAPAHGSWLNMTEIEIGSLEAGKLADLIILTEGPLQVEPESLPGIQVLMTDDAAAQAEMQVLGFL
jgi:predicted amidohydrolase YtcJ